MEPGASDERLLRAHEPVVRFTRGELFRPTAVEAYVERCSLWVAAGRGDARCIVPVGGLSLERLGELSGEHPDRQLSLRFVQEPLDRAAYRRWRSEPRERPNASARFTTTGMFGRLIDAGFRASLLLRGKVAAGLTAAAELEYTAHLEPERHPYYGRVVRDGGYVCLQYWFFYAMNDWRSSFAGVNDHEADWELAVVYLAEEADGPPRPAWVALSSHDHHGDELRRRWDDPELHREGDHPVVFAGAGSHSGAFVPGDYVISVDPPPLRRLVGLARRVQRRLAPWRDETRTAAGFGIPFVDYARGDGVTVGPGGDHAWTPVLIDEQTPWVRDFRGLWGLDTEDRFGGERAPAGPRYERDGSPRGSWANPLGWAGLLGVPPTADAATAFVAERSDTIAAELAGLDAEIVAARRALRATRAEAGSLAAHGHTRALAAARGADAVAQEAALDAAIAERARLADERHAHLETLRRPPAPEPAQAHLGSSRGPRVDEQERRIRFLRLWSAVSTPLLLAVVTVAFSAGSLTSVTLVVLVGVGFVGVEAFARRRFLGFLASLALLAVTGAVVGGSVVLFKEHWRTAVAAPIGLAAMALFIGNVRDLRHGWRRGRAGAELTGPELDPVE